MKDTSPHSTSMISQHGLNKNKIQLKKDLARIAITIFTSFFVYLLILAFYSIRTINALRFLLGEDTDEYLLITFSEFSCVIAYFLDEATVINLIYTIKRVGNYIKGTAIRIIIEAILRTCITVGFIYYIKNNVVLGIHWIPSLLFGFSGCSLLEFLVVFLFPIKKKDAEVETK